MSLGKNSYPIILCLEKKEKKQHDLQPIGPKTRSEIFTTGMQVIIQENKNLAAGLNGHLTDLASKSNSPWYINRQKNSGPFAETQLFWSYPMVYPKWRLTSTKTRRQTAA